MAVDKGMRILIVDDQDTVLQILREILRKLGFRHVDQANNGMVALEMMKETTDPYALVISDWNMQSMTGFELLQSVRGTPKLQATPFIMLTGEVTKDRVVAAMGAGVNSYIVKPFSLDSVKKKLVGIFGDF